MIVEIIQWAFVIFIILFLMGIAITYETKEFLEMKTDYKEMLSNKTLSEREKIEWRLFYRYHCNMMFFFYQAEDLDKYVMIYKWKP